MQRLTCFLLVLGLTVGLLGSAHAQQSSRTGLGAQVLVSTAENNVGPGFNFRVSTPINSDVSLAVGSGLTGFIFRGRDDAAFALDPQVSAIVSFSTTTVGSQNTYVLGGAGAYVPFGATTAQSGPTFHLGIGRAWLLQESSLFAEFNPGFLVGRQRTTLVLPIRVGIIL